MYHLIKYLQVHNTQLIENNIFTIYTKNVENEFDLYVHN